MCGKANRTRWKAGLANQRSGWRGAVQVDPRTSQSVCPQVRAVATGNFALAFLYPNQYDCSVKPVAFRGDSLNRLRHFPEAARQDAGYQLELLQRGEQPRDFKSLPAVGKGVEELRVRDDSGAYRVIYTARLAEAVYVLHAFQKKTRATSKRDIEIARERFSQLMRELK
jgi:phage-related protein